MAPRAEAVMTQPTSAVVDSGIPLIVMSAWSFGAAFWLDSVFLISNKKKKTY